MQALQELQLLGERERADHIRYGIRRNLGDHGPLRFAVDAIHESVGGAPVTVAGGAEERLGELASVLLDDMSRPIEGGAPALARL